ncbi:hypothetical protein LSUE1_G000943 [Lachnellula suecica]|uniref:Rhodopsin domain-containing protein n=1 Tax=Lachnellula suecica TaxID=602035 RepID=A0A8T9C995_9HELO|nr:hypothetical protein LSUE1_G000943 [Lachnellula suecica]
MPPYVESHGPIAALGGVMLALSALAIAFRFYSRSLQQVKYKGDDWTMLPGLHKSDMRHIGVRNKLVGYPTPVDKLEAAATTPTLDTLLIAFDIFTIGALACVKVSALLFYYRIFWVGQRGGWFRSVIFGSIGVVVLWMIAFMLLTGLQCGSHFDALWKPTHTIYCTVSHPFLLSYSISDLILDVWVILIPIPMVWTLKTNLTRKLAVLAVFLLAIVGIGGSVARLVVYVQIFDAGVNFKGDGRLVNSKSLFFTLLEVGLTCIAVNLPTLYFLSRKVKPESILRSRSQRSVGSEVKAQRSDSYPRTGSKDSGRENSISKTHLAKADEIHDQTYAMSDLEQQKLPGTHATA